jgi:hypothetical protein
LTNEQPPVVPITSAEAGEALQWLRNTFGDEWISTEGARAQASGSTYGEDAHPIGSFVDPLERAAGELSGIPGRVDASSIIPIVEFVRAVKFLSPAREWLDAVKVRIQAAPDAFMKHLAEVRVAAVFKFGGYDVLLKPSHPSARSSDIELKKAGQRVAEVECKAQDPGSPSDRRNFKLLTKIAERFWDRCRAMNAPGVRLVVSLDRDLISADVDTIAAGLAKLSLAEATATQHADSGITLQAFPIETPIKLELEVDEAIPLGDSVRLQLECQMALSRSFLTDGLFHHLTRGKFRCKKTDRTRAFAQFDECRNIELRLGKYPDRITCILSHMRKAASQVTGEVPAIMYEEWRTKLPPQPDDFSRACDLARDAIAKYPSLSAVAIYRPISSGRQIFEVISNPKAAHPLPKGFVLARP